jgi:hypothetical protein
VRLKWGTTTWLPLIKTCLSKTSERRGRQKKKRMKNTNALISNSSQVSTTTARFSGSIILSTLSKTESQQIGVEWTTKTFSAFDYF